MTNSSKLWLTTNKRGPNTTRVLEDPGERRETRKKTGERPTKDRRETAERRRGTPRDAEGRRETRGERPGEDSPKTGRGPGQGRRTRDPAKDPAKDPPRTRRKIQKTLQGRRRTPTDARPGERPHGPGERPHGRQTEDLKDPTRGRETRRRTRRRTRQGPGEKFQKFKRPSKDADGPRRTRDPPKTRRRTRRRTRRTRPKDPPKTGERPAPEKPEDPKDARCVRAPFCRVLVYCSTQL